MSKGTILYVGGFELPDKNAAAHRVIANGKILRDLGYKVVFIGVDKTLSFDSNIVDTYRNVEEFDSWAIPYPNKKTEWISYLTNITYMTHMTKLYDKIQTIIVYNYSSVAMLKLQKYCRNNEVKLIGDVTEWYSTKGSNILFKMLKGLDSFIRMRVVQKKLDGLIVISKYLENYYRNCRNVVRIPPLVDLKSNKWSKLNLNKEIESNEIKLIYSGSPGKNKDKINYIIQILPKIDKKIRYSLSILGITKEEYLENYPEHIELLKVVGENVFFSGRVSHLESLKSIKNSDFLIFFRERNRLSEAGFPTKFVESISCGIPVITNLSSDLQDYLIEGKNGFIISDINKIEEIFTRIFTLKNDEINIMKSYCEVNNQFDYRRYISEMDKLINNA